MNKVFIATSIDGYIADSNGGVEWLHETPNPEGIDMGYAEFKAQIDAIVMGRNSFETILGFGIDWPYNKPVFILSSTLKEISPKLEGKVFLLNGPPLEIIDKIHEQGYRSLYIDGGKTISNFLEQDLIDEMIITTIPVVLGNGTRLFSSFQNKLHFKCVKTEIYLNCVVQNRFIRIR